MKKVFLLLIYLLTNISFAQSTTLKVTESLPYKDKKIAEDISAIHINNNKTAIVRSNNTRFIFEIFDKNLHKTYSQLIKSPRKEKYIGFIAHNDVLNFITVFSPKSKERIIYCHSLNIAKKTHKKIKLLETTVERNQALFSGGDKRETNIAFSPNGKYFVIATDNIKKKVNAYKVHVYNANTFKLEYSKDYQRYTDKHYEFNDLVIDNQAKVYVLGKLFKKGRRKKRGGKANYQFILSKVDKTSNKDLKINLSNDLHIESLAINNNNDNLELLGFYSATNPGRIKGGCSFLVDPSTMTLAKSETAELPKQVYEDLYGSRKAKKRKKKGKELNLFDINHVLLDSKGNTYIVAEQFYISTTYRGGMNGFQGGMGGFGNQQQIPNYNDILIMKFDNKGKLDWSRSIFKRAHKPSYNAFIKNDELHIILNSGKKLTKKKDGRTKVSQGLFEPSSLYDITYDSNGKVAYNKIQNNKGKTFYLPYYGTFENNIFIMMSSSIKKRRLMKLE